MFYAKAFAIFTFASTSNTFVAHTECITSVWSCRLRSKKVTTLLFLSVSKNNTPFFECHAISAIYSTEGLSICNDITVQTEKSSTVIGDLWNLVYIMFTFSFKDIWSSDQKCLCFFLKYFLNIYIYS